MDLVGGVPTLLKNSQLGWSIPIYGKIKTVPNHQPFIGKSSINLLTHWGFDIVILDYQNDPNAMDGMSTIICKYHRITHEASFFGGKTLQNIRWTPMKYPNFLGINPCHSPKGRYLACFDRPSQRPSIEPSQNEEIWSCESSACSQ